MYRSKRSNKPKTKKKENRRVGESAFQVLLLGSKKRICDRVAKSKDLAKPLLHVVWLRCNAHTNRIHHHKSRGAPTFLSYFSVCFVSCATVSSCCEIHFLEGGGCVKRRAQTAASKTQRYVLVMPIVIQTDESMRWWSQRTNTERTEGPIMQPRHLSLSRGLARISDYGQPRRNDQFFHSSCHLITDNNIVGQQESRRLPHTDPKRSMTWSKFKTKRPFRSIGKPRVWFCMRVHRLSHSIRGKKKIEKKQTQTKNRPSEWETE